MKILHVVPSYLPATRYGGPIYSVHGLCAALVRQGLSVSVYTTSVDGPGNSDVEHGCPQMLDGVEVSYFESSLLRRIYYSRGMKKALQKQLGVFDLLHLHSIFLYPTNTAARIAERKHVPYVLSPRGMLDKALIRSKSRFIKNAWLTLIERTTIANASLIHLTSERESSELDAFNYAFPERVIIPNGVDRIACEPGSRDSCSNDFRVLFIGRIHWKKQIGRIIESLQHINFEIELVIAGNDESGHRSTLERLINNLGLNDGRKTRVRFMGEVTGDEKYKLYSSANAMLLPSISENFGNTVIEAMAMGCPVIVTPEVGASNIVAGARAGLITDGTPRSIASCLMKLKNDPEMARTMSVNGVEEIQRNFIWEKIAARMINAYQGVLGNHA